MQYFYAKREMDNLLGRLRPSTTHAATYRKAIEGCFEIAETMATRKRDLSYETGLSKELRKAELTQLADGILYPRLASLTREARKAKARINAERSKYVSGYMPIELSGLLEDVGCIEAATYFAERELKPVSNMGEYDRQMLMNSDKA